MLPIFPSQPNDRPVFIDTLLGGQKSLPLCCAASTPFASVHRDENLPSTFREICSRLHLTRWPHFFSPDPSAPEVILPHSQSPQISLSSEGPEFVLRVLASFQL